MTLMTTAILIIFTLLGFPLLGNGEYHSQALENTIPIKQDAETIQLRGKYLLAASTQEKRIQALWALKEVAYKTYQPIPVISDKIQAVTQETWDLWLKLKILLETKKDADWWLTYSDLTLRKILPAVRQQASIYHEFSKIENIQLIPSNVDKLICEPGIPTILQFGVEMRGDLYGLRIFYLIIQVYGYTDEVGWTPENGTNYHFHVTKTEVVSDKTTRTWAQALGLDEFTKYIAKFLAMKFTKAKPILE